ncbi:uncharacterized protein LOC142333163 isoform X2 [Lycorma delicatula]|uniref:uncharacterized protein LOC142333163 isoform X2 n=1 Tax=Lycorma delicatula TaxID=130591 RepID=UPI003F516794
MHRHGLRREAVELDKKIWEWSLCVPDITKSKVQSYAKKIFLEAGILTFKASDGWYRRWRKRWKNQCISDSVAEIQNKINKTNVEVSDKITPNYNNTVTESSSIINESICDNNYGIGKNNMKNYENTNCKTNNLDKVKMNNSNQKSDESVTKLDSVNGSNKNNNKTSSSKLQEIKIDSLDICLIQDKSLQTSNCIDNSVHDTNKNILDNANINISVNNISNDIFHIPRFSLSSEILNNYSLLENGDEIFCKNCGDFHVDDFRCNKVLMIDSYDNNNQIKENNDISQLNIMSTVYKKSNENTDDSVNTSSISVNNSVKNINNKNNNIMTKTRKKGERYLPQFKSKVIAYAKTRTIKSASIKYNVSEGTISEWIRAKVREETGGGHCGQFQNSSQEDTAEKCFIKWLGEMRKEQRLLSQSIIYGKVNDIINKYQNNKQFTKKLSWLKLYFERLKNIVNSSNITEKVFLSKSRIGYPVQFKMEVALYAEKVSQQAAARVFCVARKRVFEWLETRKTKGTIENVKAQGTSYVTDAQVDKEILTWYNAQPNTPTSLEVREMGRKLYEEKGHKIACSAGWFYRWRKRFRLATPNSVDFLLLEWLLGELDKNQYISHLGLLEHAISLQHKPLFKASRGWAIRFCKRYTSLLQKMPTINAVLPPVMELKVSEFRSHIQDLISNLGVQLENIGTLDEIPIHFIHSSIKKKELLIRRPGFDNCQASVIITSLANGKVLPSVLILKGSCDINVKSAKDVLVFFRKDGCVDEEIMMHWLNNVWFEIK